MKSKLNIKKKAVLLSILPSSITDAGLDDYVTNHYSRWTSSSQGQKNTWENFAIKTLELDINPFIVGVEDYYLNDIKINNFTFDSHTLQSGDNLYFIPGTAVPRYKVKERGEKVGFKTRKTHENANVFILDEKALNKISAGRMPKPDNRVIYSKFIKFINHIGLNIDNILTPEQKQIADDSNEIYFTGFLTMVHSNLQTTATEDMLTVNRWESDNYARSEFFDPESLKFLDIIEMVCTDKTKSLIHSSSVLEQINDTSFIDEKMYNRLQQMFKSDEASVELAMDLMSNVDLKKSLFYILLLIKEHSQRMKYTNSYTHSNFKAFRQSLDNLVGSHRDQCFNYSLSGPNIMYHLGNVKLLKKEHVDYFKEDIKRSFHSEYSNLFSITKIEASDALKKMLVESAENLKQEPIDETIEDESV